MKQAKPISNFTSVLSAIFMLLALLWLTVSTPFVFRSQQAAKQIKTDTKKEAADKSDNTPINTTEEKTENGVPTISEYLPTNSFTIKPIIVLVKQYKCRAANLYLNHHPESFSPPPEA